MMKTITVDLKQRYNIIIESSAIKKIHKYIEDLNFAQKAKKAVIISDSNVAKIYKPSVENSLEKLGYQIGSYIFPAGEQSKNIYTIKKLYDYLFGLNITRSDFIIALGGGVVGDMAGFVAATYLRGIPFIQVPTSLLAQIDSSVGGKTGFDLEKGKNLVGSFYQPQCVIVDPDALSTLPEKFFRDGMGEAIKYACIADSELFELLLRNDINKISPEIISRCLKIKKSLIEKDEKDTGERMLLNFGHTIGHAIEAFYKFSKYTHGEAVCIGMMLIAQACVKNNILTGDEAKRLENLISYYKLPSTADINIEKIVTLAMSDKKRTGNDINLILLKNIGHAYIKRMSKENFKKFIMKVR